MLRIRTAVLASLVCVSLVGASGCKKKTPTESAFNETVVGTVSSFGVSSHAINITRNGNMTLKLTWTGTADLDLYLTSSTCLDFYVSACVALAKSDALVSTTETIVRTVSTGETFKAWVDNFETAPVNYSIQITVE